MDDKTHQQVAPAALFQNANPLDPTGAGNYYINCSNPLLSAQQQSILCTPAQIAADKPDPGSATAQVNIGRRNIEGGARYTDFEHTNYRAVFGAKGDFARCVELRCLWAVLLHLVFRFESKVSELPAASPMPCWSTGTAANPSVHQRAPEDASPTTSSRTAASRSSSSTTCMSWVPHREPPPCARCTPMSPANSSEYGIKSPLAAEGVGVNIGFEHRNDHELLQPDAAEESGLLSGFGSAVAPIDNSISVAEEFVELRAPLMQDKPGAKELLFDTGYRRSDYSTIGVTNTYKFEVQYAPIADYRIRASYDRAIRAPSVAEAFTPPIVGITTVGPDPCAPPITYTLLQCERTGVTAAQYNRRLDSPGHGRAAVGGNQRQPEPQAGTGGYLHPRREFRAQPDSTSHGQHRLLPYPDQGRDRRHPLRCWFCPIAPTPATRCTAARSCASRKPEA